MTAIFVPLASLTAPPVSHRGRFAHRFRVGGIAHVLVPEGSRVFAIGDEWDSRMEDALEADLPALLDEMGIGQTSFRASMAPPASMPVRSLSLAVAQKCNLSCTYCYAQQGGFGEEPASMPSDVAVQAVELLFSEAKPGEAVMLAFLGGEPLTNRSVLREATERAAALSVTTGINVRFAVTTNGTLVRPDDSEFFERHGFAVTVSLDGVGAIHDALRPFAGGQASYRRILENVRPLLTAQRNMQVSARVTVTPNNLDVRATIEEFIGLGFSSVGVSPMLASPSGSGEMDGQSLDRMLSAMIECGMECEKAILARRRYPFSNLVTALEQIHRGTHRPYPCGAGGSYFGVSAEGGLYACHRFINDPAAKFGGVHDGLDVQAQHDWLQRRHVDQQQPCSSCWARYLCGGGCHHEVIHRGRTACNFIRGWLEYCLKAYVRLIALRPDYFGA